VDEPLLTPQEQTEIWNDLLSGPRPRRIHPEVRSALLQNLDPDEEELVLGLLEIVETGGTSIEDLLAEFDREVEKGNGAGPKL
jgi:hypothetical protein